MIEKVGTYLGKGVYVDPERVIGVTTEDMGSEGLHSIVEVEKLGEETSIYHCSEDSDQVGEAIRAALSPRDDGNTFEVPEGTLEEALEGLSDCDKGSCDEGVPVSVSITVSSQDSDIAQAVSDAIHAFVVGLGATEVSFKGERRLPIGVCSRLERGEIVAFKKTVKASDEMPDKLYARVVQATFGVDLMHVTHVFLTEKEAKDRDRPGAIYMAGTPCREAFGAAADGEALMGVLGYGEA